MSYAIPSNQEDEQTIRGMAEQAFSRLNNGDLTVFEDFWAEDADYVSVDGRLIKGRDQIQAFFGELIKFSDGKSQQSSSIERIRFLTPELVVVDGIWTVTGARDAIGKDFTAVKGRGREVVQKREGRWRFVTRSSVVIANA